MLTLLLPNGTETPFPLPDPSTPSMELKQFLNGNIVDLMSGALEGNKTSEHYSEQWGKEVGIGAFLNKNKEALAVTLGKKLGWPTLIERIREESAEKQTLVYDAGCGFGGLFQDLFEAPHPPFLVYVGADIHKSLGDIAPPPGVPPRQFGFLRFDVGDPLPIREKFDYVICRAAIHHTPEPRRTFSSLVDRVRPGGVIAISAYRRKGIMREAVDDALRARIVPMTTDEAWTVSREFTLLGRDLRDLPGRIVIRQDLPFLGIAAGDYGIQEFIYQYFMKCWFNEAFGEEYSDVTNFDWYHPEYARRYDLDELKQWFSEEALEVTRVESLQPQHYIEGRKP